jgi:uncharacterized membrane protein
MSTDYEELEKLHQMKEKGIIDEEEFNTMKKKILSNLTNTHKTTNLNISGNSGLNTVIGGTLLAGLAGAVLIIYFIIVLIGIKELSSPTMILENVVGIGVGTIVVSVFIYLASLAGYIVVIYGLGKFKKVVNEPAQSGLNMIITAIILWLSGSFIFGIFLISGTSSYISSIESYSYSYYSQDPTSEYIIILLVGGIITFIMSVIGYVLVFIGLSKVKQNLPNPTGIGFILAYFIIGLCSIVLYILAPLAQLVGFILLLVGLYQLKTSLENPTYYR